MGIVLSPFLLPAGVLLGDRSAEGGCQNPPLGSGTGNDDHHPPGRPETPGGKMTEEEHEELVQMAEPRVMKQESKGSLRFGSLFGGINVIRDAWKEHEQLFAVDPCFVEGRPDVPTFPDFRRVSTRDMKPYRNLDVLVVTLPRRGSGDKMQLADMWVCALCPRGGWKIKPRVVVLVEDPWSVMYWGGKPHAMVVKEISSYGYQAREFFLDAKDCGASVDQQRYVTLFIRGGGDVLVPRLKLTEPRAFSNLLVPPGLVAPEFWKRCVGNGPPCTPYPNGESGARVLEDLYLPRKGRVYDPSRPMPLDPGGWIRDPKQGVQPIFREEFGSAIGVPKAWEIPSRKAGLPDSYRWATCYHIW